HRGAPGGLNPDMILPNRQQPRPRSKWVSRAISCQPAAAGPRLKAGCQSSLSGDKPRGGGAGKLTIRLPVVVPPGQAPAETREKLASSEARPPAVPARSAAANFSVRAESRDL